MKKIALFMLAAAASCTIKNDIDFPLVPGDITDFVVEHQLNADISKESRSADLSRLELLRFSVSEDARCDDLTVGETLDLSKPLTVHVKTYQDYVWTIYATVRVSTPIDVNAWADHAVFTVPSEGSVNPGIFEWRKEGESDWATSPEITPQAGLYVYEAGGLEAGTNYYVRFSVLGTSSGEVAFSTEAAAQVANMSFDQWCSETVYGSKTSWYPAPGIRPTRACSSSDANVPPLPRRSSWPSPATASRPRECSPCSRTSWASDASPQATC